jgi:hypothetical protein
MRASYFDRSITLFVVAVSLCAVASCGVTTKFQADQVVLHQVQIQKAQVRVGLYLEPEFSKYTIIGERPLLHKVELGDTLAVLSKQVMAQIFDEVILVENQDKATLSARNIRFIIHPELKRLSLWITEEFFRPWQYHSEASIRWTVVDLSGKLIFTEEFSGEGESSKVPLQLAKKASEAISPALSESFSKMRDGFLASHWWSLAN